MAIPTKEQIIEALNPIQDPEIQLGIIDLGLVYDIIISETGEVKVMMTLTTPACPYGEILLSLAQRAIEQVEGVTKAEIVMVWDPPWDPKERCSDHAKDMLGIW